MNDHDLILIIDMQNVYKQGQKWACRDFDGAAQNICRLVQELEKRNSRAQIMLTEFLEPREPAGTWCDYNKENAAVNHDAWLNDLASQIKPLAERYPLFSKSKYNSLEIPAVRAAAIAARDQDGSVILTGVVAECCVLWTACAAVDLGCKTIYLTDAVSGLDREKEQAAELVLSGLDPLQTRLMTTEEYLSE